MSTVEAAAIRAKWLQPCGPCDAGLAMTCTHPDEDYRPTMAALCDALDRARADLAAERERKVSEYHRCEKVQEGLIEQRRRAERAEARIDKADQDATDALRLAARRRNERDVLKAAVERVRAELDACDEPRRTPQRADAAAGQGEGVSRG